MPPTLEPGADVTTILNDAQRRILTYIQAANHGGYSPTAEDVVEWVERPDLKRGKVTLRRLDPMGPVSSAVFAGRYLESIHEDLQKSFAPFYEHLQDSASKANVLGSFTNWMANHEHSIEEREPDETLIEQ